MGRGGFTLPVEPGCERMAERLASRWGADAIRTSDGTEFNEALRAMPQARVETVCLVRMDDAFARARPELCQCRALRSRPVPARDATPLVIDPMAGWSREQVAADSRPESLRHWQVIDRSLDVALPTGEWEFDGKCVVIRAPLAGHDYAVNFIVRQRWDATTYYNRMINNWRIDRRPPLDPVHPEARRHLLATLHAWLAANPDVDVVRLTSLIYHFPVTYDECEQAASTDWFGYADAASPEMLDAFECERGSCPSLEDILAPSWHPPTEGLRDWAMFVSDFVRGVAREWVDAIHRHGRQALLFMGDHWIGSEPYLPGFNEIGFDAVVGTATHAVNVRMLADIPGGILREARLHPYFFPDQFQTPGQAVGTLRVNWPRILRAMLRSPLDRIGFGGYLHLIKERPEFLAAVDRVVGEFRAVFRLHAEGPPEMLPLRVGVIHPWGAARRWMNAPMWYEGSFATGHVEALATLPAPVEYLSQGDLSAMPADQWPDVLVLHFVREVGVEYLRQLARPFGGFIRQGGVLVVIGFRGDTDSVFEECGSSAGESLRWEDVLEMPAADFALPWREGDAEARLIRRGAGCLVCLPDFAYSPVGSTAFARLFWALSRPGVPYPLWWCDSPGIEVAGFPASGSVACVRSSEDPQECLLIRTAREPLAVRFPPESILAHARPLADF